jgi:hypothetical protein
MQPDELDLVPVGELKAALLRRFDHVVVAGFDTTEGKDDVTWGYRGDPYRVIGLMEEIKHRLFTQQESAR